MWWYIEICCCCLVSKPCPALCNSMDCSPPGSSVHGVSQGRILECVTISSSRGSSQPKDQTHVSCTGKRFFSFYLFIFKWRIIALQYCLGFCQTSTWISHMYTYVPSLLNLPPASLSIILCCLGYCSFIVLPEGWEGCASCFVLFL